MPLVQTRGAASAQGFGEFAQVTAANYIEDVFSCFLFTGTGSNQTITNNIDLSTKGGLVWTKCRSNDQTHNLIDTVRGGDVSLNSASTGANDFGGGQGAQSFTSTGFVTGGFSARTYASWTFREQPKFFDVVTWSPDGSGNATVAHSLNSVPGCVFIKKVSATSDWQVYHRSLATNNGLYLNTTDAAQNFGTWISVSSTQLSMSGYSAGTYIAYLFAHDAGGFGLTGTDNVISCGLATVASADAVVTLGWEPQYVLYKQSDGVGAWTDVDSMRGLTVNQVANNSRVLFANNSNAEETNNGPALTATGFILPYVSGNSHGNGAYIYIAIRRGPMKVPTLGTSVFTPIARTGTGATATVTGGGFATDLALFSSRNRATSEFFVFVDRLRGRDANLGAAYADVEYAYTNAVTGLDVMDGFKLGADTNRVVNFSGYTYINYFFRRAPGFFDEVCYTGTGSNTTFTHNLGVVPELILVKRRDTTGAWDSYCSALANTEYVVLNTTAAKATGATRWNSTTPTSSVFSVGTSTTTNASAGTYVAYLFATLAGVSKVGSYTGNGTTQTINCGFTGGARFVLIKRTDSTGDWMVSDSARGIVSGNDPYLELNNTNAEVTGEDWLDTDSTGFVVNEVSGSNANTSSATYIFLAIA
jgi:hypothetical protein